jgi:2-dehydropantoate 2-reductase
MPRRIRVRTVERLRQRRATRILVVGAGVIGGVYAGHLARAGHEVTLLARGSRLDELRRFGLQLRPADGALFSPSVTVAGDTRAARPDLVVLAVRREQAMSAARQVSGMQAGAVLLFGNYAGMTAELAAVCGRERTAAGFPGVGGRNDGGVLTYRLIAQQRTVVGTLGRPSVDVLRIATDLRHAGFPTRVETDMEGWLATHAALVVPMAAAIHAAGGSAGGAGRRADLLMLAVRATRAIYRAQVRDGRLVAGANLRLLYLGMPEWFARLYWSRALRGDFGELAFAAHTRHAWTEMALLAEWLRTTVAGDREAAAALDDVLGVTDRGPSSAEVMEAFER